MIQLRTHEDEVADVFNHPAERESAEGGEREVPLFVAPHSMHLEKTEAEGDCARHDEEDQLIETKMIQPDEVQPPRRMTVLVEVEGLEGTDGVGFNPSIADGPDNGANDNREELEMRVENLVYLFSRKAGYTVD